FERFVGVAEHFVDDDVGEQPIIGGARRRSFRKRHHVGGAIGEAPLRNALLLRTESVAVDESAVSAGDAYCFAAGLEVKTDMVGACADVAVSMELHEGIGACADEGERHN